MPFRRKSAFVAYPAAPKDLAQTIEVASQSLISQGHDITYWPQLEPFGTFIADDVREAIEICDVMVADITKPNMNVYYELGFAIGQGKIIAPVINTAFKEATSSIREIGLFSNIGYKSYENSVQLASIIQTESDVSLLELYRKDINFSQPLYLVDTLRKTDFRNHVVSAIKASKSHYRSFDPVENQRISVVRLVAEVTSSSGVILPYLPAHIDDFEKHNLRAAFTAGLAAGLGRRFLLITDQKDLVGPTDYGDDIKVAPDQIAIADEVVAFCQNAAMEAQAIPKTAQRVKRSVLQTLTLGASAAENEFRDLEAYFVETSEYLRAVRGELNLITGRKGSGKSAIFFQTRDNARRQKGGVIVDLKPESHQLSAFREQILSAGDIGLFQHTIAAFWYFVILSEVLLEIYRRLDYRSKIDGSAFEALRAIENAFDEYQILEPGDFTTRLNRLTTIIAREIRNAQSTGRTLTVQQVTNMVFGSGISSIRDLIIQNSEARYPITFLFDNVDKGWPATGVEEHDATIVRLLIEALGKVRNDFAKRDRDFISIVFVRHDVYDLVLDQTPDRGKSGQVSIDWTDRAKLSQVVYRRLQYGLGDKKAPFNELWSSVFPETVDGQPSLDYLLDHCLMRPRFLIDIVEGAIAHAINRGHASVTDVDCESAVADHSQSLIDDFGFEIRDVSGLTSDLLYHLIASDQRGERGYFVGKFTQGGLSDEQANKGVDLMLWYGLLGVVDRAGTDRYIYDYSYNMKRLKVEATQPLGEATLVINPALYVGLSH